MHTYISDLCSIIVYSSMLTFIQSPPPSLPKPNVTIHDNRGWTNFSCNLIINTTFFFIQEIFYFNLIYTAGRGIQTRANLTKPMFEKRQLFFYN